MSAEPPSPRDSVRPELPGHAADAVQEPAGTPDPSDPQAHRRHLARSTAVFSVATGLSRVLGLVREMVAAYLFGVSGLINAFTVAFQIPNLVRALVADSALSGAFVPIFSGLIEQGDRRRAWRVASTIFWLVLIGLSALTAVLILLTPLLIRPFGDPGGDPALAVGLARLMFPIVMLLGLTGVIVGILNAYDHFTVPALTPVVWNAVIIVGLVVGVPAVDGESAELYVYAGSVLFATLVQLLMPLPILRRLDGRIRPVLDWRDPAVRRFFALMLPVTVTLGLINVNAVIGTLFASRLIDPELAPAAIDKAFRLYMLPQGMFSVAVATILFPTLARLAARGDADGFRRTIDDGLRLIGFLLIPASLVAAALAVPITRLVYQRGAFTAADTDVVASCLAAFSIGLVFNGWMLMLMRGFYALQSNWAPTLVALGSLTVNVLLNTAFYRLGVWGLPLATSVSNVLGVTALLVLLHRRIGLPHLGRTAAALGRITLAAVLATAVATGVWRVSDEVLSGGLLGDDWLVQLVTLSEAFVAGLAVYLACSRLLGVRELRALLALRGPRS